MKRLRVSAHAERDLDQIWLGIAIQSGSTDIADTVVDSLTAVFPLFAHTPQTGTQRDHIELGVRGFPAGKYIIYYRESGRYVIVARILHGMRDQLASYFAK